VRLKLWVLAPSTPTAIAVCLKMALDESGVGVRDDQEKVEHLLRMDDTLATDVPTLGETGSIENLASGTQKIQRGRDRVHRLAPLERVGQLPGG
jgi:hypothetical protein